MTIVILRKNIEYLEADILAQFENLGELVKIPIFVG